MSKRDKSLLRRMSKYGYRPTEGIVHDGDKMPSDFISEYKGHVAMTCNNSEPIGEVKRLGSGAKVWYLHEVNYWPIGIREHVTKQELEQVDELIATDELRSPIDKIREHTSYIIKRDDTFPFLGIIRIKGRCASNFDCEYIDLYDGKVREASWPATNSSILYELELRSSWVDDTALKDGHSLATVVAALKNEPNITVRHRTWSDEYDLSIGIYPTQRHIETNMHFQISVDDILSSDWFIYKKPTYGFREGVELMKQGKIMSMVGGTGAKYRYHQDNICYTGSDFPVSWTIKQMSNIRWYEA